MPATQTGLPTLAVAHSDVLSWWRAVHREAAPREWGPYRREVVAGLRAADRVVAPTAAVLDDLARHYGFDPGSALVIPNGIDTDAFYAPQPKRAAIMAARQTVGRGEKPRLCSTKPPPLSTGRSRLPAEANHPEGGQARLRVARALGVLTPAEMAERLGRARSMRRRRGTNLLALAFSKPPPAAARWCSATFRRYGRTGTAPRCSCRPTMPGPGARRCRA